MNDLKPCPPRPVFETLPAAVEAALNFGNFDPLKLNLERWAQTYSLTAEQVKAEFDRQRQKRSLTPCHAEEFEGK